MLQTAQFSTINTGLQAALDFLDFVKSQFITAGLTLVSDSGSGSNRVVTFQYKNSTHRIQLLIYYNKYYYLQLALRNINDTASLDTVDFLPTDNSINYKNMRIFVTDKHITVTMGESSSYSEWFSFFTDTAGNEWIQLLSAFDAIWEPLLFNNSSDAAGGGVNARYSPGLNTPTKYDINGSFYIAGGPYIYTGDVMLPDRPPILWVSLSNFLGITTGVLYEDEAGYKYYAPRSIGRAFTDAPYWDWPGNKE